MKHIVNIIKNVWNTIFIFVFFIFIGCTPEEPIEQPNQAPTATLSVTVNTNKTLSGTLTGTDSDGSISLKEITIKNGSTIVQSFQVTDNNWSSNLLSIGNYTVIGKVTDNDGASATKQENTAIQGLTITITSGTTTFDENQMTNQEVVGTIVNVNNISGVTYSLDTNSQNDFEIVGNQIKVKSGIVFDFENAPNAITITASANGEDDAQQNISLTIIDKNDRLEDILIKATHCKAGFAKVDVADNDPNTQNIVEYELDQNGVLTNRTFADIKALIDGNTSYPHPGGNFLDILSRMGQLTLDDSGNQVYSYTDPTATDPGIFYRNVFTFTNLSDGTSYSQTTDQITESKLKEIYGFAYNELITDYPTGYNADSWLALTSTIGDEWFFSGFTVTFSDNLIHEQDTRNLDELYVYLAVQALNVVKSQATATEMETLVSQYMTTRGAGRITDASLLQGCN
ncbi:hypothetical protein [Tenacibaculum xiamenense]|uniref:hypothetical protein n=1 Tax=Tenacibaculum xiamenense TaxID=1261553 RepID=UPI003892D63F